MFDLELEKKAVEFVKNHSETTKRIPIKAVTELEELGFSDGRGQWPSCKIMYRAPRCRVIVILYIYKSGCHFEYI